MADLSAVFKADFGQFFEAVNQAEVKFKGLQSGASDVGKSLNRMVDGFSGRKVIQDATLMVEAVERIGGVGKLTQQELERVASQAQNATAKMKALGMEVPANLQKIADAAKPAAGGFADILKSMTPIAGALGITFSVGAVVNFAKGIFDAAGSLVVLSDQTGISIEGLQRLEAAGDDAGNSVKDMAGAVNQLQNRLAEGDKSAVGALEELGIQLDNFKRLQPDQQFIRISDALRKIEDPAEQVRLAMDLFGKQGAVLLPTLKRGFDDLKDSVHGMSEGTVRDLDTAGDTIAKWAKNTGSGIAEVLVWIARLPNNIGIAPAEREAAKAADEMRVSMEKAREEANRLASQQLFKPGLKVAAPLGDDLKKIEQDLQRATEEAQRHRKAQEEAAEALKKHNAELRQYHNWIVMREFEDAERQLKAEAKAAEEAAKNTELFNSYIRTGGKPLELFATNVAMVGTTITTTAQTLEKSIGVFDGFGDFLKNDLAGSIVSAFSGGGDAVKTIGGSIGSFFTREGGKLAETASKGLTSVFGKSVGGALGAIVPGLGAMLGPGLELAMKGIGKLFGRDEESKVVNPLRDQFIAAAGGLTQLNLAAHDAGTTLDALLRADKEAAFKSAVDELTGAFQFQDAAMQTLTQTAARYGFTLEELGPALQRQELDKQAQQLFQDWQVLNAAGIDTVAITKRMAESVNAYVNQAIAMGAEVPEAMRPMLQSMVDMGTLTDAQGNKIDSLEDSGISFALTMSEGFKKLIDSVGKLTDAIARGLGLAVDTTSDKIKKMPRTVGVDVVYHDPGFKTSQTVNVNYSDPAANLEGYQHGTDGFRDFGAGTPVMLHGKEAVIPFNDSDTYRGLGEGAGAPIVITIDARGALFGGPGDDQRLAEQVERALSARHGLTNKRRAA